ncbi:hypothetical protein YC2023_021386 [Brassica napus]
MARSFYLCIFLLFITWIPIISTSFPLSTNTRWIVDEKGQRVKLACVNWPAHLQPAVAEGLSKQPLDSISKKIVSMGFNCVRLTWPLDLMTNDTLALKITVKQSFESLNLFDDALGIQTHNPKILNLPIFNAFQEVVSNLGQNGLMVILDNHLTYPGWCCSDNDLDAFFGYPNFDPVIWAKGLGKMATLFRNVTNVIGMSLRNEPRGTRDYPDLWFRFMPKGAEAVHAANPEVLVILSGIDFDTNLSFLRDRFFNVSFTDKLVFEQHWYSFSHEGGAWVKHNSNDICAKIIGEVNHNGGFLLDRGFPLILSEFGTDERGVDVSGNRYMNCLVAWAAEKDLDWAVWALTGDYYLRIGTKHMVETYGVLDATWKNVRNSPEFNIHLEDPVYKRKNLFCTHILAYVSPPTTQAMYPHFDLNYALNPSHRPLIPRKVFSGSIKWALKLQMLLDKR